MDELGKYSSDKKNRCRDGSLWRGFGLIIGAQFEAAILIYAADQLGLWLEKNYGGGFPFRWSLFAVAGAIIIKTFVYVVREMSK